MEDLTQKKDEVEPKSSEKRANDVLAILKGGHMRSFNTDTINMTLNRHGFTLFTMKEVKEMVRLLQEGAFDKIETMLHAPAAMARNTAEVFEIQTTIAAVQGRTKKKTRKIGRGERRYIEIDED
jgi:hypothetical protein